LLGALVLGRHASRCWTGYLLGFAHFNGWGLPPTGTGASTTCTAW
jgi:hypothetical protein